MGALSVASLPSPFLSMTTDPTQGSVGKLDHRSSVTLIESTLLQAKQCSAKRADPRRK